jgi:hypothetical protein
MQYPLAASSRQPFCAGHPGGELPAPKLGPALYYRYNLIIR